MTVVPSETQSSDMNANSFISITLQDQVQRYISLIAPSPFISRYKKNQEVAMVPFRPLIEGEKKYSPPLGLMNVGRLSATVGSSGSVPVIVLTPPCPMRGSSLFRKCIRNNAIEKKPRDEPRELRGLRWEGRLVCPSYRRIHVSNFRGYILSKANLHS